MVLTLEEVENIAGLARLNLSKEEKEIYRDQLSQILDYAAHLQAVDTGDIPPTFSVLQGGSVWREDEPHPGLPVAELLRNAPDVEANQFRVPQVLE
jgi:aspartyl-tRNA(Asn)/glutamyl-tRNA(Gln) amidotransferase subunit C